MRGGGGWFGIDEINFGIENKLYVHLRAPCPQLSAPLEFISETRIINSETFSAPTHQTKHIIHAAGDSKVDIPVLPCLVTCYSATTYLLPQHTAAVWILVVAISPQHPLSAPLAPEAGRRPCGLITMSPPTSLGCVVMAGGLECDC